MSTLQAPFPWFGGKRRASLTVSTRRPVTRGRVETVNDADGWLVNAWRAIRDDPAAVARHAYGPVTEIDYHARLAWLQERRTPDLVAWLEGDPENCDPKAAGWWLYVLACGIGDPFGPGPWRVVDGHLRDTRKLPHLGNAGRGVLESYMRTLADRLARVRITCGDWRRILTPSVIRATAGNGTIGVFLDPPYDTGTDLYAERGTGIAAAVRDWCASAPREYRIVLCGYDADHDELLARGWRKEAGRAGGGAGYSVNPRAGRRERLWLSPACQGDDLFSLFENGDEVA